MAKSIYSFRLVRLFDDGRQTMGRLEVYRDREKIFECDTLELPWLNNNPVTSCYPSGTYDVLRRWSNAHGWHFHVLVPGRAFRLFHSGNFAASKNPKTKAPDTKGCTLVGKGFQDITGDGYPEILNSSRIMQELLAVVPVNSLLLTVTAPPIPVA